MIEAPKGYVYPSQVVSVFQDHLPEEWDKVPSWLSEFMDEDDDATTKDQLFRDFLEFELIRLCKHGLHAWKPGCEPTKIANEMPLFGTYPDVAFFSALTDVIFPRRKGKAWKHYSKVPLHPDGKNTVSLFESRFRAIDLFVGYYALFSTKSVNDRLSRVLTLSEPAFTLATKKTAAEKRAELFYDLPDEEFSKMGGEKGKKYLASKGEHCSEDTARRAVRVARKKRGLG